ncbi:MAG: hypothetical protein RL449_267 [Bacteroidota bacterium]|jgi:8-oxo-dGTP pyrophosphatase MutT (NUDIX family)
MKEFETFRTIYRQILLKPEIKAQAIPAAVVVLFLELPEQEPQVLLIERNQYDGHHSGQMALPGGKMDPNDLDLREAAAREVLEEIGVEINPTSLDYITEHWIHVSNYWMTAFSIRINKKLTYDLNKREINRIFEIPVSFFQDPANIIPFEVSYDGNKILSPSFTYEGNLIWGATALIMYQLFHGEEY